MEKYERILLRKDGGKLTLNGYYQDRGALFFDVLYDVEVMDDGRIFVREHDDTGSKVPMYILDSWREVSDLLGYRHGCDLYGMQKADARVMDFLKKRETMMERALMEYVLPKGARKGFPPGRMDGPAVEEVESFADWKRRKEHWESVRSDNVASHP